MQKRSSDNSSRTITDGDDVPRTKIIYTYIYIIYIIIIVVLLD